MGTSALRRAGNVTENMTAMTGLMNIIALLNLTMINRTGRVMIGQYLEVVMCALCAVLVACVSVRGHVNIFQLWSNYNILRSLVHKHNAVALYPPYDTDLP